MTFSALQWFGGSWADNPINGTTHTSASPLMIDDYAWNHKRFWRFTLTGAADAYVRLPDARTMPTGAEVIMMQQTTASGQLVIVQDKGGNRIGSIDEIGSTNAKVAAHLLDNTTENGIWCITSLSMSGIVVMA